MIEAIEGAIKSGERKNARVTISENRRDAFYDATCINIAGQYCLVTFKTAVIKNKSNRCGGISWPMFHMNSKARWPH